MNAINSAKEIYGNVTHMVKTPKRIEYEVFAKVTHQLKNAAIGKSDNYPRFITALHQNRRLWTLLATDVADAANQLTPELRGQIVYLAEFTNTYTSRVIAEKISVRPLLDINTAILRGLKDSQ